MKQPIVLLLLVGTAAASFPGGVGVLYGDLNPTEERLRSSTPLIVAEESGGALLGGAVGAFAAALAGGYIGSRFNSGGTDDINRTPLVYAGYSGGLLGLPLGAATCAYVVGALEKQGGAWWASTLGAYAGTVVGVGLAYLAFRSEGTSSFELSMPFYILAGIAPVSGAVIGYNISTPCLGSRCYEERLGLQGQGLTRGVRSADAPQPAVRVQLLSLRI